MALSVASSPKQSLLHLLLCLLSTPFVEICHSSDTEIEDVQRPNIVLMVMDDWGFNDVSWHQHSNVVMPFLDNFARNEALRIESFYVYPLCSITRSALLTGRYPIRYGLQSSVVENAYPFGLSIFETLMAEELKAAGYATAMIGKWHLGFHRADMTPLRRGFAAFHGSLSPMIHFWTYSYQVVGVEVEGEAGFEGLDLYRNEERVTAEDTDSEYLTEWEKDQFVEIVSGLVEDEDAPPFFVYVPFHASHSPHDAPDECLALYEEDGVCDDGAWNTDGYLQCDAHKVVLAQTSCADSSIQDMITALKQLRDGAVWDNTLLIFLSDNGAPVWDSDNSPLRGGKKFLFEGGVRTPAFIAGGYLNDERKGQIFGDGKVCGFCFSEIINVFVSETKLRSPSMSRICIPLF